MKTRRLTITLPADLANTLGSLCRHDGHSIDEAAARALRDFINGRLSFEFGKERPWGPDLDFWGPKMEIHPTKPGMTWADRLVIARARGADWTRKFEEVLATTRAE
jgi:hypothetical protein